MKKTIRNLLIVLAVNLALLLPVIPVSAAQYEFRSGENGKLYWYENDVRQGTYDDALGIIGDGTIRGREIFDPATNGWYWLDSVYSGAKAEGKEVWVPYVYQDELITYSEGLGRIANGISDEARIRELAQASNTPEADMSAQVEYAIRNRLGKWVRYDENGKMLKGWVEIKDALAVCYPDQKGNVYYYDTQTGLMAKGYVTIKGVQYHFDEETGVLDGSGPQNDPQDTPQPGSYEILPPTIENVVNLTRTYDPEGYTFLAYVLEKYGEDTVGSWIYEGESAAHAADTCVHESFHMYSFDHNSYDFTRGCWQFTYYLDPANTVIMGETSSFRSEEWASSLPEELRTFRYDTYVGAGSDLSSNLDGAYGLINEFCAYCWGLNDQVQLYPYFYGSNNLDEFDNSVMNGIQAFTEFRFYILGYLDYAKTYHNDIYQDFLNNTDFVNVYCVMERKFENLIKQAGDWGIGYWTNESYVLYNEVAKPQYQTVEQELFSRATLPVLPSIAFNPQYNENEGGYTAGDPVIVVVTTQVA